MVEVNNISKKTQGRQKNEIKKLKNKSNKHVTFSKRCVGLFKKAGELNVLCGAEVAAVVFSPNSKVFCFNHPNPEAVIHRYIHDYPATSSELAVATAGKEFKREYGEAVEELEAEKNRAEEAKSAWSERFWWEEEAVEGMRLEELLMFMVALKEMGRKVVDKTKDMHTTTTAAGFGFGREDDASNYFGFGFKAGGF